MTPDPTPPPGEEPEAAPPVTSRGSSVAQIVAIAAAVAGGGLVTLLVMTSRPAAREEPAVVRLAPAVATRATSSASTTLVPVWSNRNQGRWVSNHRNSAAFESVAIQPVAVWMKQVRPTLVVRCMDNRTDVFVYTESAARLEPEDENHTVRVALDDEAGTHQRWPDS